MRPLKKLDIPKSIRSKKLIFQEGWFEKLDTLTIYAIFLMLIGYSFWGFNQITPSFDNSLEYFVLTLLFSFSLYVLYCKFSEKHLKEIKSYISSAEAKDRIIRYAQKRNYRISKPANNLIYLNEPTDLYSLGDYEQTTIIFFKDNSILYTVIKEGAKSNFPALLSQHLIKMNFKKKKYKLKLKKKVISVLFFMGKYQSFNFVYQSISFS
ncbi:hypothetical protein [Chryseobacterium bernardetii]|uniref:hypothetical protein n=1 Tax=Chryseobacterium bernardetii TaxID=1241978 RepID=UPI003AF6C653